MACVSADTITQQTHNVNTTLYNVVRRLFWSLIIFAICNLDYEIHASECHRMFGYKIYLLTHIIKFINTEQALCMYHSKILPYFDYGDIFYETTF